MDNKYINIFNDGLDVKDFESVSKHMELVGRAIWDEFFDMSFIEKNKDAIISFGDWFLEEIASGNTILSNLKENSNTTSPIPLLIYAWEKGDKNIIKLLCGNGERWDKYMRLFLEYMNEYDMNEIESMAIVNSKFKTDFARSIRERNGGDSAYADILFNIGINLDPEIVFVLWFAKRYSSDTNILMNMYEYFDGAPLILKVVEEYVAGIGKNENDKEIEYWWKYYERSGYLERKDIDNIFSYIFSLNGDKKYRFFIKRENGNDLEYFVSGDMNEDDKDYETDKNYITSVIKGRLAALIKNDGYLKWSHKDGEKWLVCGVYKYKGNIEIMDKTTMRDFGILFDDDVYENTTLKLL